MSEPVVLPWLRLWTEFATDPQVQTLSFDDQRHYVMLLCLKRMGVLDKPYMSAEYRNRAIGHTLGLAPREAGETHRRLFDAGLIDELWQPRNWDKRQPVADSAGAERTRRWRERKRQSAPDAGDVTVTSQRRLGDGRERESDSESESESEEREGDSLSEFRIPECPKDMDEALEHQACVGYYAERGTVLTSSVWRSWVLRAVKSGVYAKRGSRPPTEEEIRATRRELVARMEADEQEPKKGRGH